MFCKMLVFSSQIYLKAIFLYCPRFFLLTKNLNTAPSPTEMGQNVALNFLLVKIFYFYFRRLL